MDRYVSSPRRDWLTTLLILAASTAISLVFFFYIHPNSLNISLIYILALILIAQQTSGYQYGIVASFFLVLLVNFLFTYPYFKIHFSLSGYPVTFIGMLAISVMSCATTTRMKRQAQELARQEKHLMEADKEKMRANLLRAVSHDLRTPLTSIIGTSSSLIEHDEDFSREERAKMNKNILDDSKWLLNMVENLLAVTRIHGDTAKVHKYPEMVEEVVSEAVLRLKKRLPQARVNVTLPETTVPEDFLMIPMDATLIEQVIINLLENSIIHGKGLEPTDLVITADDKKVSFRITDYGVGIPLNRLNTLFDGLPSDTQTSDGRKGMGIGLSICKTIIVAHGGTIIGRNHEKGAEFLFSLPIEE